MVVQWEMLIVGHLINCYLIRNDEKVIAKFLPHLLTNIISFDTCAVYKESELTIVSFALTFFGHHYKYILQVRINKTLHTIYELKDTKS